MSFRRETVGCRGGAVGYIVGAVSFSVGTVKSGETGSAGNLGEVSFKAVELGQLRYQSGAANSNRGAEK